jgi:hypothetical protein
LPVDFRELEGLPELQGIRISNPADIGSIA